LIAAAKINRIEPFACAKAKTAAGHPVGRIDDLSPGPSRRHADSQQGGDIADGLEASARRQPSATGAP